MYPVSSATPPLSSPIPIPIPAPRSSHPVPDDAMLALPPNDSASSANPLAHLNAARLIDHPRPRYAHPDQQPKPSTIAYRLRKNQSLVEEHLSNSIRANWSIYDGDAQNLPALIAYMNQTHPGLDLRYADSPATLLDTLEQAPEGFHLRFILQDKLARARRFDCPVNFYAEFVESPDRKVSGWMLVQAAAGPSGASSPTLARLLLGSAQRPRLAGMRPMPVNTYNQVNIFDTVMFAAHAAWTARDNAAVFRALHETARTDVGQAGQVNDFHHVDEGQKRAIFCRSYYEHQQTRSGEQTADSRNNDMSIFQFRLRLLAGAARMQSQLGYAEGEVNRTIPSGPMRRSSAPANHS